jgi:hypothetical protein
METNIGGVFANESQVGFKIKWFNADKGEWGEILITRNNSFFNFDVIIDSENMNKDFVKNVLCTLVDNARLVHEMK